MKYCRNEFHDVATFVLVAGAITNGIISGSRKAKINTETAINKDGTGKLDSTIEKNINKALNSKDPNVKLEGEVAYALGDDVVSFQKEINLPKTGRYGEIDVETSKYIIEVTNGKSSKTASEFSKYYGEIMNPDNKQVILYAPNLKATKIPSIEAANVKVFQTMEELLKFIGN